MSRLRDWQIVTLSLLASACGGKSCDDPPPGSAPPAGNPKVQLEGCANLGPQAEEFADGVEYQCVGRGRPVLFTKVTCTGSSQCPGDMEMDEGLANFEFGEEDYDDLSIGACCGNGASESDLATSCEYSCGATVCDQILPFLRSVRSSEEEMKALCCDNGDCEFNDVLLDVCKDMLDKYIVRVSEDTGHGSDGTLSWTDYCKSLAASGLEDPDRDNYDFDAECEGVYLGDVDVDWSFLLTTVTVSFRNTCIYPRCDVEDPATTSLPSEPNTCVATRFSERPEGWPENGWEAMRRASLESGDAFGELGGGLQSELSSHGFPSSVNRPVADGRFLYSIDCTGGPCELTLNDIKAHANGFTMNGDSDLLGTKKLQVKDTYMFLNRGTRVPLSEPDTAGTRYFTIPGGEIEMVFRSGARGYFDFHIGGSETLFDVSNEILVARNSDPATGYLDASGRIALVQVNFEDGDFSLALSLMGQTPISSPDIVVDIQSTLCGDDTVLDASGTTDAEGGPLSFEWTLEDGTTLGGPTLSRYFPEGEHTVFLEVTDTDGMIARQTVRFVSLDDTTAPEFPELEALTYGTCGSQDTLSIVAPTPTDDCSSDEAIEVTGRITQRNGQALVTPIPIVSGGVTLSPGDYLIEWTAVDEAGNPQLALQSINLKAGIRTTNSLKLNNGARIILADGGFAPVANSGPGEVAVGVQSAVGGITSQGNVLLSDNAKVYGDILTAGVVGYQNVATITVTGATNIGQTLTFGGLLGDSLANVVFPPRSSTPLNLNPSAVAHDLAPGSYPDTNLNSGATLVIHPGTYYFKSLFVNDASQLLIDDSPGNVRIFIEDGFRLSEPIQSSTGGLAEVFIGYTGTQLVNLEASYAGTLVAPNARLVVGQASYKTFSGRYVAKDLELGVDVELTCHVSAEEWGGPGESCYDNTLNQDESDTDCGGVCDDCGVGQSCAVNADCSSDVCVDGTCTSAPGTCNEATAIDLGITGSAITVDIDGCVMVRDQYPDWWGTRNLQLQSLDGGSYPVPYTWSNSCAGGSGTGTFTGDWQSNVFGPTSDQCTTLIDLQGTSGGTVSLRYYGN